MDLKLRGKKVLSTGASQGIGEGLAEVFAEEGCNLHLVARSGAKMNALAEKHFARAIKLNPAFSLRQK